VVCESLRSLTTTLLIAFQPSPWKLTGLGGGGGGDAYAESLSSYGLRTKAYDFMSVFNDWQTLVMRVGRRLLLVVGRGDMAVEEGMGNALC
jgi:hypothetical protein